MQGPNAVILTKSVPPASLLLGHPFREHQDWQTGETYAPDQLQMLLRGGASDDALAELIRGIWTRRADRYSELRASLTPEAHGERKVEMFYIGG
jgi:hypothetical protein